jgi:hypothetical protein
LERLMTPCPACASYRAALAWAEHKLRRLLALSPSLDAHDRATVRAVAEALGDGNPRLRAITNNEEQDDGT